MDNYTPNPFITQSIYDPTRPFATPSYDTLELKCCRISAAKIRQNVAKFHCGNLATIPNVLVKH